MKKIKKNCLAVIVTTCLSAIALLFQGCATTNYGEPVKELKKIINIEIEFKKDVPKEQILLALTAIDKHILDQLIQYKIPSLEITIKHIPLPSTSATRYRIEVNTKVPVSTGAIKSPVIGPKPPKRIVIDNNVIEIIQRIIQLDFNNHAQFDIQFK